MRLATVVLVGAVASIAACGGSKEKTDAADTTAGMGDMKGMGGTMDSMQAHMRMMDTMSAASTKAMLPMHRQMVANELSRMNADMRSMNMTADAAWTTTVDSVRRDLVRMADMPANELRPYMPAHGARVMRLMQMHQRMMGNMKN